MKTINLQKGNIAVALLALSLPIIGSSLIQMIYTISDTAWVGFIGSQAVTALGTAGMFLWIGQGVAMIPQVGADCLLFNDCLDCLNFISDSGFKRSEILFQRSKSKDFPGFGGSCDFPVEFLCYSYDFFNKLCVALCRNALA